MITIKSLALQLGKKILFEDASVSIFPKEKVGLIGINGSGKSTLFSLLLKKIDPDAGDVSIKPDLPPAYLSQDVPHDTAPAIQYVINGDQQLISLLRKLQQAEENQNGEKISELHARLYEIDGYSANARAAKLLNGLGFSDREFQKPVNEFSGGWRMRLNLAQVLMCRSEIMLLDEPTNYLDLDTIVWLENWLQEYNGTLLLISHDREFLDNTVQKIIHITNHKLEIYSGNYSGFERQRAEKLANELSAYEKQQAKIAHLNKYIERFKAKASKAKQAQSRIKVLEKMEKVVLTHIDSPFLFNFSTQEICSSQLLNFEDVDFSYDGSAILHNVNFSLSPKDRIGILGVNGAGKTTFMKLLAGTLKPSSGNVFRNKAVKTGYFAQHQVENLNLKESPFSHIMKITPTAGENTVRTFLGGFAFKNEIVFSPIENFSGGEKARLALALLVWQKPNLLLLDEPTNHLDLDMREALVYALQNYSGAIVLVSHDRYLLTATVDDFILVDKQNAVKFNGDLSDYQKWLLENKKPQRADADFISTEKLKNNTQSKSAGKKMHLLEAKLDKLNAEQKKHEAKLLDVTLYLDENKKILHEQLEKLKTINEKIKSIESEWMDLA